MPPNTQRTERPRRPDPVLSCGQFVDDQRWHRNDTSRELWDMAVLWSAAFGEPIEKSGS
jgi:hypothetical protein